MNQIKHLPYTAIYFINVDNIENEPLDSFSKQFKTVREAKKYAKNGDSGVVKDTQTGEEIYFYESNQTI